MAKHKRVAFWALGEAASNLILSIVLVRRMGIYGVAWGSAIPSVFCELILWPAFVSNLLAISVKNISVADLDSNRDCRDPVRISVCRC